MTTTQLVSVLLLTAAAGLAQNKPAVSYKDIKYPPLRSVKVPQPARIEMPNGMTLFLLEDHELPAIGMAAMIRTGSRYVPADKAGLAFVTGRVMRTGGTATRSGDDLDKLLDGLGASVETGIETDAGSAFVSVLKEDVDKALPILSDVLRNPAFPQDKVDLTKTELRDGIARRNESSHAVLQREFGRLIYGTNSGYTRLPQYDTVNSITRADLVAFHKQYYQPENVILGVWGDFNTADMRAKIEKEFGSWARGGHPKPEVPAVDPAAKMRSGVYVINKDDVNQSEIQIGGLGGKRNDPDYYANVVLATALGGGFGSRLMNRVRSNEGLAYSTFAAWGAQYDHPGLFFASAGTKSQTTMKALELIKQELEKIGQSELTDKEFQLAKDSILKGTAFDFDSTSKIVLRLMNYEYSGYPSDYLQRFNENINKVTKADALRVAKQYWNPANMAVLIVGKQADFDKPQTPLGQITSIDISIPKPKAAAVASATPESLASGKALLAKVREAMGGDKLESVKSVVSKANLTVTMPQGEMNLKTETMRKAGKSLQKMVTPMGEVLQGFDGEKVWMKAGGQVQDAPPAGVVAARDEAFRETIRLLSASPGLTVQSLGESKLAGKSVMGLLVSDPAAKQEVKIFVDPATNYVAGRVYSGALFGPPGEVEEVYLDYKDVNGVKFPSHSVLSQNGAKRAELKIDDIVVNSEIPDSAFARP
ncbi:MAG: pitrilysin family protein [Bryobacteraceae bacterium]